MANVANCSSQHMVPSSTWIQSMQKELTCTVCLQIFQDPVNLPCGHEVCKRCIRFKGGQQARLECSLCSKDGLFLATRELEDDFALKNLCKEYTDYCKSLFCKDCTNNNYWVYVCSICSGNLCETCITGKCTGSSGVHSLSKSAPELQKMDHILRYDCELHPDEETKYMCTTCNEAFCGSCSVLDKKHNGENHKVLKRDLTVKHADTVYETAQQRLDSLDKNIHSCVETLKKGLGDLLATEEKVTKQCSALKRTISRLLDCQMLMLLKNVHTQRVSRVMLIQHLKGIADGVNNLKSKIRQEDHNQNAINVYDLATVEENASNLTKEFEQVSNATSTLQSPKLRVNADLNSKLMPVIKTLYCFNGNK